MIGPVFEGRRSMIFPSLALKPARFPRNRLAPPLIVLLLGCSALAAPAHAGWLFGGDDDAKKPAEASSQPAAVKAPATDIEGNVAQARMLRLAGNYEEAVHHLSQLMLVASDDPRVLGEYGKTLAQMGRAQDAVQFLTRAQQLNNTDWTFYSALGVAYDQLGDQAQAQAAYQHALTLRPGEASVLNNYALSRLLAHDPETARKLADQARAAGGETDPKIKRNLAMIAELAPTTATAEKTAAAEPVTAQPAKAQVAQAQPAKPQPPAAEPAPAPTMPVHVAAMTKAEPAKFEPVKAEPAKAAPRALTGTANAGAHPFVSVPATAPRSAAIDISDAPKPVQPQGVVMQKVPVDPLAGPVHTAARAPHVAEAKTEATPKTDAPKAVAKADNKPVVKAASAEPAHKPDTKAEAKPAPVKANTAKPQVTKAETAPAKTAQAKPAKSIKDTVPALRLSANAY
jgi:Flp pilus assembly protein TadD